MIGLLRARWGPLMLAVSMAGACGGGGARDASVDAGVDAGQDGGVVSQFPPAPDPFVLQGEVSTISSATDDDWMPHVRDDGLELFFSSNRPEFAGDAQLDWNIWVSTRPSVASAWSTPILVTALSSAGVDWNPILSDDGLTIYFGRDKRTFRAERSDSSLQAWTSVMLVASLNIDGADTRPSDFHQSAGGSETLFLFSNRAGGHGTALADYDIWIATRPDAVAAWTVENGGSALDSAAWDTEATLVPDLLSMYLQSRREGGIYRLFQATRASTAESFGVTAIALEFVPASSTTEIAQPNLMPDGKTMYFARRHQGGSWDIDYATR